MVFFVEGASIDELWNALVHLRGERVLESTGVYDFTWLSNVATPALSLVTVEGRVALVVEGIKQWFDTITIDVPGYQTIELAITEPESREIALQR